MGCTHVVDRQEAMYGHAAQLVLRHISTEIRRVGRRDIVFRSDTPRVGHARDGLIAVGPDVATERMSPDDLLSW